MDKLKQVLEHYGEALRLIMGRKFIHGKGKTGIKDHCCNLMGLGNLSLGNVEAAQGFFDQAVGYDGNHLDGIRYRDTNL